MTVRLSSSDAITYSGVAALLVTADGRYLMQLRDNNPEIFIPDHWCLFGGSVDPGETAAAAIVRELREELEFSAPEFAFFTEILIQQPLAPPCTHQISFFTVPVDERDLAAMVQHEGADRRLFTTSALAAELRVAPWHLVAVLMHARRGVLFA
jgi:8-oxo-dGTP pyrophosphatase MutT (NUDIX family)